MSLGLMRACWNLGLRREYFFFMCSGEADGVASTRVLRLYRWCSCVDLGSYIIDACIMFKMAQTSNEEHVTDKLI